MQDTVCATFVLLLISDTTYWFFNRTIGLVAHHLDTLMGLRTNRVAETCYMVKDELCSNLSVILIFIIDILCILCPLSIRHWWIKRQPNGKELIVIKEIPICEDRQTVSDEHIGGLKSLNELACLRDSGNSLAQWGNRLVSIRVNAVMVLPGITFTWCHNHHRH